MSRASSRRSSLGRAVLIVCGAAILVAPAAHAGIGDFVKKAKDKAKQAVTGKAPEPAAAGDAGAPPVFDDVVLELTPERLDMVVATLKKSQTAATGRPELVAKLEKLQQQRSTIFDKNEEAMRAARNKRDEVESCYHEGYNQKRDQRAQEYQQRALTDPALREKFAKAAAQHNAAAAKGDSAAIAKLNEIMMSEVLPSKEDSAEVRKQCGTLPPKSAAEKQVEDLDKQIASTQDDIRKIDDKVADEQAKTGSLSREQWAMALERIKMYMANRPAKGPKPSKSSSSGSGSSTNAGSSSGGSSSGSSSSGASSVSGFSRVEVDALEKRLEELRALLG